MLLNIASRNYFTQTFAIRSGIDFTFPLYSFPELLLKNTFWRSLALSPERKMKGKVGKKAQGDGNPPNPPCLASYKLILLLFTDFCCIIGI